MALLRLLAVCAFSLALPALAHAKCAARDTSFWPAAGAPLAPSGLLYVRGFGGDQATVAGLKGATLKAGKQSIPLVLVGRYTGSMALTQAVFRASTPLTPGTTYTLTLQGKTKAWRPTRWLDDGKGPVQWTVAAAPDAAWTGVPTLGESSYQRLGCGPAIHQTVALPLTAQSGLVEVTIAGGKATQRYALPVAPDGTVHLGHGMCSGAFDVSGDGRFEASFALIDGAGARIPAPASVAFGAVRPTAP